ncbi:MAG TPA: hypothetical protein VM186_09650 [Planctomycetota bacterium]|nr:hypothetical protein [Planctomycetota bacterium]
MGFIRTDLPEGDDARMTGVPWHVALRAVFGGVRVYLGMMLVTIAVLFALRWVCCADVIEHAAVHEWIIAATGAVAGAALAAWGALEGRLKLSMLRYGNAALAEIESLRGTADWHNGRPVHELVVGFTAGDGIRYRRTIRDRCDRVAELARAFPMVIMYDARYPARTVVPNDIPG